MEKYLIQFEPVDGKVTSIEKHDPDDAFAIGEVVELEQMVSLDDLFFKNGELVFYEHEYEADFGDAEKHIKNPRPLTEYEKLMRMRDKANKVVDFSKVMEEVIAKDIGGISEIQAEYKQRVADIEKAKADFKAFEKAYETKHLAASLEWCKWRDRDWEKTIKYETAICLICRDENEYLPEFIVHHLGLGFDHIFIYDNDSVQPLQKTVDDMEEQYKKKVTVSQLPSRTDVPLQYWCYNKFFKDYGRLCKYVLVIDTDEQLDLKGKGIKEFIAQFDDGETFGAIHFNWELYNASGQKKRVNGLLRERFSETVTYKTQTEDKTLPYLGKCLVKCSRVSIFNLHCANLIPGSVEVDVLGKEFGGVYKEYKELPTKENSIAVVRHYFTKSMEEWIYKMIRGNVSYYFFRKAREFLIYNPEMENLFNRVCKRVFGNDAQAVKHEYQRKADVNLAAVRTIIEEELLNGQ